jgi:putative PEP-CTERM system TPR-repeat lipoprotein
MLKTILRSFASIAVCATILAACDGGSASEQESIDKALAHMQEGDGSAAIIELKNALQTNPESADARALLGELYFRSGDSASAAKELQRARELGRNENKIRLLLAQSRVQIGEYQQVIDDVPADMPIADDVDAELLAVRGQALFGLGKFDEARETLETAVATRPTAAGYAGLARMALFQQDAEAANQYLEQGEAKFADDGALKLLRGEQQLQAREFEGAQKTFEDLSKAEPENLAAGIGLARSELALGRVESARVVIDDMMTRDPKNLALYLLRAVSSLQARDYTAAQQDANAVLAVEDGNPAALYVSGASSYGLKQYEQALRSLSRYVAVAPGDPNGRKLLAATQVQMDDPEAARRTLGNAADVNDPDYLSLLSAASALAGDASGGLEYLERAVLQSPEDARLRAQLGMMRIATGDPTQGQADLDQALGIDPSLADDPRYDRAEIALIQSYLSDGKFDEALVLIQKWQQDHPGEEVGLVMEGVAYAASGDVAKAREAFGKAIELNPGSPNASANLAILELRENDPKAAEMALQQVLEHHPDDLRALVLLAQLSERAGERDKTRNWLERAVAAHPDNMATRVVLGRLYFELNEPQKSLEVIEPVVRQMPENIPAREVKARAQLKTGNIEGAISTYRSILAQAPDSVQPHYELSQAYALHGEPDEAFKEAQTAVTLDPNHTAARLQLARLALQQGDAAEAETAIAALEKSFPDAAEIKELRAQLLLLNDDPEGALALFREVRKTLDVSRIAIMEARAQAAAGDNDGAAQTLEKWVTDNPRDVAARLELNRFYAQAGRKDDAEANLKAIIEDQPDVWIARNDLAWMLYEKGDYAAARPHAERANELAPENPAVMDTLGVILLELGETNQATALIRRANEQAADNPTIAFHLARAYAQGDRKDEARQLLATLLDKHPSFAERDRATALLADLGG